MAKETLRLNAKIMQVSGFTIVRNASHFQYPATESIRSILPICDEFVVNVGDSDDNTLEFIHSIKSPKIKIIQNTWDFSQGKEVLSHQTNLALKECSGDWAFYLQTDEVIHEADLEGLLEVMEHNLRRYDVDAIRLKWLHFYGSYHRYRIDAGWYQKQDRIIRNNAKLESCGDAYGFRRIDGQAIKRLTTPYFVYHYGWVQSAAVMAQRRANAKKIGFVDSQEGASPDFSFGDLNRFPVYFGSHPKVMNDRIRVHELSREDLDHIQRRYWWHPALHLKWRYKTWRRVKEKIL